MAVAHLKKLRQGQSPRLPKPVDHKSRYRHDDHERCRNRPPPLQREARFGHHLECRHEHHGSCLHFPSRHRQQIWPCKPASGHEIRYTFHQPPRVGPKAQHQHHRQCDHQPIQWIHCSSEVLISIDVNTSKPAMLRPTFIAQHSEPKWWRNILKKSLDSGCVLTKDCL